MIKTCIIPHTYIMVFRPAHTNNDNYDYYNYEVIIMILILDGHTTAITRNHSIGITIRTIFSS